MSKELSEIKPTVRSTSPLINNYIPQQVNFPVSDLSTISSEFRIGRQASTQTSSNTLQEARNGGRLPLNYRRYSFPESQGTSPTQNNNEVNLSKLSKDQIIDLMEREQDGIVLKLIKEIEILKEENSNLKMAIAKSSNPSPLSNINHRRNSSMDSRIVNYAFNSPFIDDEIGDRKKFKRKSSQEIPRGIRINSRKNSYK